jgi:uncharacterized protein YcgI (DUF1989 family)
MVAEKYGATRFQEQRNEFYKNGYDSFLNELGKYGMGKRDLVANVNFFSKVVTDEEGGLRFQPANSKANDFVDLRFEMSTLVILATCQHPLDPEPQYHPRRVRVSAFPTGLVSHDDACRNRCPENQRGFRNTEMSYIK